jgi:hypothetical protein
LGSVDALRGITVAAMLLVNNPGDWSGVAPLLHSEWHGCTPTDLVFPFFLFIVGVSIALGIAPRVDRVPTCAASAAVLVRALRILGVGLLLHLLAFWLLDKAYFRIGACCSGSACVSSLSAGSPLAAPARAVGRAGGAAGRYGLLLAGTGGTSQWINPPAAWIPRCSPPRLPSMPPPAGAMIPKDC